MLADDTGIPSYQGREKRTAICCRSSCKWLLQVRPFATVYFTIFCRSMLSNVVKETAVTMAFNIGKKHGVSTNWPNIATKFARRGTVRSLLLLNWSSWHRAASATQRAEFESNDKSSTSPGKSGTDCSVAQMQPLLLCQLQIQLANVCVPWWWCCSHHLAHLYLFPLAPLQLHIHNALDGDCRLGLLDMFQSNVDLRDSFRVFVPVVSSISSWLCVQFEWISKSVSHQAGQWKTMVTNAVPLESV